MSYTEFYSNVQFDPSKITWKEIFSEFRHKHSKKDMEYAMLAGSSLDRTTEATMLQHWNKPWLFWRILIGGIILIAFCIAVMFLFSMLNTPATGVDVIILVIGPMVVPIALMILFWELNIPRNISIYSLLGCFLVGAIISFLTTGVLVHVFSFRDEGLDIAFGAPLREEPAKLVASVALLYWFSRKKGFRVYGLTGLVIGAAVGTGFSAFESVLYGMVNGLGTVLLRMLTAAAGHTLFSAPYAAAIALHMQNNRLSARSFFNADFLLCFLAALLEHIFWNSGLLSASIAGLLTKFAIVLACEWLITLSITRKCLKQAVLAGTRHGFQQEYSAFPAPPNRARAAAYPYPESRPAPYITGLTGEFTGQRIRIPDGGLRIGRDAEHCNVVIRNTIGISRQHCLIWYDNQRQTLIVQDLNSSYGTFLGNGTRVPSGQTMSVRPGGIVYLTDPNMLSFRFDL